MRIMTSERCPECGQILWIQIDGKKNELDTYVVINGHGLAANVYLDKDGVLCIHNQDFDSKDPTYHCTVCNWWA